MSIRELSITYGTLTVNPDGKYTINKTFVKTTVTYSFVITAASESAFASAVNSTEATIRQPYQDFSISQGSATLMSLKPSANTGLNTKGTIVKFADSVADTGRSRRYTVTIEADMPADSQSPLPNGLRESTIDVRYDPSGRRHLTISGITTALSSYASRAEYNSIIATYCTSVLTGIGGTYKLAEIPKEENDGTDKLLSFTRIYDEIIFNQGGTGDDADLSRQQLSMNLNKNYPGDTPEMTVNRMVSVSINYDVWVKKTVDIKTKWENQIKSWLVSLARSTFSLSAVALVDENVSYLKDDNRITANLTLRGAQSGTDIIEEQITYNIDYAPGEVLIPIWGGDSLEKESYQGPATKRLTIDIVATVMGTQKSYDFPSLARAKQILSGYQISRVSTRHNDQTLKKGKEPYTHTITIITSTDIYEAYHKAIGAGTTIPVPGSPSGGMTTVKIKL